MLTGTLRGRQHVLDALIEGIHGRHATLLYGPLGAGKTAVLRALADRLRGEGHPCAFAARTSSRTDVKAALATIPATEDRPPAVLLDGVVAATAPMRTFLRWLQGRGSGIVIAVDVANQRDHQRARRMRLAYRELELPPLEARIIRELIGGLVPAGLVEDLVSIARGLPGRAHLAARLAAEPRYWSKGALMRSVLETDVDLNLAGRAMITLE